MEFKTRKKNPNHFEIGCNRSFVIPFVSFHRISFSPFFKFSSKVNGNESAYRTKIGYLHFCPGARDSDNTYLSCHHRKPENN